MGSGFSMELEFTYCSVWVLYFGVVNGWRNWIPDEVNLYNTCWWSLLPRSGASFIVTAVVTTAWPVRHGGEWQDPNRNGDVILVKTTWFMSDAVMQSRTAISLSVSHWIHIRVWIALAVSTSRGNNFVTGCPGWWVELAGRSVWIMNRNVGCTWCPKG